MPRRRSVVGGLAASLGLTLAPSTVGWTQAWPTRPLRLIVPFPAGGSTDVIARLLAEAVAPGLGQPIVVDNRSGASGAVGIASVAKAPPDGYTIGLGISAVLAVAPHLQRDIAFDPLVDLAPICLLASGGNILVVQPKLGIATVEGLIDLARKSPAPLVYGSPGQGTSGHLAMVSLAAHAGVTLQHVPYRGAAPLLQDFLADQLPAMWTDITTALPHISGGRMVGLAVNRSRRISAVADVPTLAERGIPFDLDTWFGLVAPAGTAKETIGRLNGTFDRALRDPAIADRLERLGFTAMPSTPEAFAQTLKRDFVSAGRLIKLAGLSPQ